MAFNLDDIFKDLFGPESDKKDKTIPDFEDVLNFDNSFNNRDIYLGEIEDGTGASVNSVIRFWNRYDDAKGIPVEDRKPIKIYINSPGGLVDETMLMYDTIKASKTPVWGIVTASAFSGGFFTLLACDRRIGYKNSSYLYHEGSTGNGGTSSQFNNYADFYKNVILARLKKIVLDNTKYSEEEYEKMKKEDIWLSAEEALEHGVIDEITEDLI